MKNKFSPLIPYIVLPIILILIAIFAPFLMPQDPYSQDLTNALKPPNSQNILGTDRYGRDVFSRVIIGSQTTICTSLVLLFIITIFGSFIGVICGYKGGIVDNILMRISDVFLAFPQMVFAIAVSGILGGGLLNAGIALAIIAWPKYARLSRGLTLTIRSMPYIQSAKMSGTGIFAMIWNHILPNIAGTIFVTATLDLGIIIMELAGLSFLGLGAMPPTAEWGAMMNNGRSMLQTAPWVILSPGFAIFFTVVIFNLLGDKLRDVLDPKNK